MLGDTISKIRTQAKMTQAQFSEIFGVSQQSVQKWERNASTPDLEKLIMISKYFDVSLDALILGNDNRVVEEMTRENPIKPQYQNLADWEFYASNLLTEYNQSYEEGLDVESYKEIFTSVARLPKGEIKKKLGDVLYEVISTAKMRDGYEYIEPSDLEQIKSLRKRSGTEYKVDESVLEDKIRGAWMGRICGCMLGRSVEGVHTDEFIPFLKETGNYPMHRYIYKTDITDEIIEKYTYAFNKRTYADQINAMPADDDLNYVVMAQKLIERHGVDFTPYNVSQEWIRNQSKDSYCTAERVADCGGA